uniref:Uncharacterized protein n=1 Tax=Rhizophora mucronata TaxID=61149 RepID=A0A2P2NS11_RHIMU
MRMRLTSSFYFNYQVLRLLSILIR